MRWCCFGVFDLHSLAEDPNLIYSHNGYASRSFRAGPAMRHDGHLENDFMTVTLW